MRRWKEGKNPSSQIACDTPPNAINLDIILGANPKPPRGMDVNQNTGRTGRESVVSSLKY
jgi:hypothetical protein